MKKEVKIKKITNEDLAIMMANSFSGMEERLTNNIATKEDLKNLEERLTKKIDNVEEKLTTKIDATDRRIDDFAETKATKTTFKELETRVTKIEKKLEIA